MSDRKRVIYDIEQCICHVPDACRDCSKYKDVYIPNKGAYTPNCMEQLLADALELLKKQESEWLEDSDPGQEYGTTWACRKCMHSIHRPYIWNPYDSGYKHCPHCGAEMKMKLE